MGRNSLKVILLTSLTHLWKRLALFIFIHGIYLQIVLDTFTLSQSFKPILKTKIFDAFFVFLFSVFFATVNIIILDFVKKNSLFKIFANLLCQSWQLFPSFFFLSFYRVISFVNETIFTVILGLFFISINLCHFFVCMYFFWIP